MNRLACEDGYTLPELLVGALLAIIVLSASLTVLDQFTRMSARTNDRVATQDKARQASRELARSLRNMAPSPELPAVIERGDSYDLVFLAVDRPRPDNGANVRNLKRVRYCLDASDTQQARLLEQTRRWSTPTTPPMPASTACPGPAAEWGTSRLVAEGLTNRSGGTDRPLWTYKRTTSGQITGVRLNLFMNDEPETPSHEVAMQTGVYLRNQNRAPTALFTAALAGVRHVLLNGSTSSDPEGDPLTYFWFVNGAEVGRGLIFNYAAPAGGSYEFRLAVRDPSGLVSRSPTQTVVLP